MGRGEPTGDEQRPFLSYRLCGRSAASDSDICEESIGRGFLLNIVRQ
jgi:hypothetical protein